MGFKALALASGSSPISFRPARLLVGMMASPPEAIVEDPVQVTLGNGGPRPNSDERQSRLQLLVVVLLC
jgi:hypothetical protein